MLPLLKEHIKIGPAGIIDHPSHLMTPDYIKIKKEWTEKY